MIVTPVAGRWIDHLGHRAAYVLSALATAAGVVMTLAHWLPMVVAGLAVCSSGVFICQSRRHQAGLGHVAGRARSSAAGVYATFYYIGGTAGATLPAIAWKVGGWPACVAVTVGVLGGVIALALIFWKRAERGPIVAEIA